MSETTESQEAEHRLTLNKNERNDGDPHGFTADCSCGKTFLLNDLDAEPEYE